MERRNFLKVASLAAAPMAAQGRRVTIEAPATGPVSWAAAYLRDTLTARGVEAAVGGEAREGLVVAAAVRAGAAESCWVTRQGRTVRAEGGSERGVVFALTDLADRARLAADPVAAIEGAAQRTGRPANAIRGVSRLFSSDVHDLGWFHDRQMWPRYLDMLATHRFNRFQLAFGIGYDFLREVTDAYFLFLYPFLMDVAGYGVRVPQLDARERERNLASLRFITEQTAMRGIHFQLGIWTHGYQWTNSPSPTHTIEGLNKDNHGPYCRDAVRQLLEELPAVSGVTFRVHGESGVEEGSYEFWKTVFAGVTSCGRRVEIDMHSKGMDQTMLDLGVATGLPLYISPKFWAEHMGMPYHQADIRPVEHPRADGSSGALMRFSAGSRNFTRYGYADLLREDRRWGVIHRIWPGTQRLLLWGDPAFAAAYSRAFSFAGSDGVDLMEPLSFKGRRGSGLKTDRAGYADEALRPRWDWEKYTYGHRVWGRLLYDHQTPAEVWRRQMEKEFGAAAAAAETALAQASRILPVVTSAHCPSAANNTYWPEVYTNHSMDASVPHPYSDTPAPKVFGNVSPLDPQLFYRMNDYADDLLGGKVNGRYTPVEVATWLEGFAAEALRQLALVEKGPRAGTVESRRLAHDVAIQAGLGRFFAAKFRAGVLHRIFERTGSREALEAGLGRYRAAREEWSRLAGRAQAVYVADLTVGERAHLRGHWSDRLAAIDADIAAIGKKLPGGGDTGPEARKAISAALAAVAARQVAARHTPPPRVEAGKACEIVVEVEGHPLAVRLHYRRVNQAERFQTVTMERGEKQFRATIPGEYTRPAYPVEYYFEVESETAAPVLYPGFGPALTGTPYFLVRQRS